MADYIVKDTELTSVANAIRTAGGTSSLLTFPNGFANAINNISGGGGSSDFSTAEVMITITAGESYLQIPTVVSTPMDAILNRQVNTMSGEVSLIVPLYKGSLALSASAIVAAGASVNVTGDIQYMGGGGILITGNGTITIS